MSSFTDISDKEDTFIPFEKFGSFRNAYVEAEVDYIQGFVPATEEWVALEKVHGCNFSATTNGEETRWASRSGYLDAPTLQKFNNAPIIVDKYESNIQTLLFPCLHAMALEEKNQHITHIRVYGELFGGKYEGHKASHRAIQKEVAYCPGIEFIVFDIECVLALSPENSSNGHSEGKSEPDTDRDTDKDIDSDTHEGVPAMSNSSFFLTHEEVMRVCRDCQLPVLDVMHTGTLADMLALVPVFQSTLPTSVFNLPPSTANNEAEGFVLKPKSQVFYKPDGTRIMLKHKNPSFHENCHTKAEKVPTMPGGGFEALLTHEVTILEQMKPFVNANRINAVLSKLTEAEKGRQKLVFFKIVDDAHADILIEMSEIHHVLPKKSKGKLKKHLLLYTEEYCNINNIDFTSS